MIIIVILSIHPVCLAASDTIKWTPEELAFIKAHPSIRLGVDPEFIPYEFFDVDGTYKGIARDYIDLISQKTGITMTAEKGLTWPEAYDLAAQKKLDVLPCIAKTPEREQYFLFSEPYFTFERVIFVNEDNTSVKSLNDLTGKKVAVQKNTSHQIYLEDLGNFQLSLYDTIEEALMAVSLGHETAFVSNLASSSYLIKKNGITHLKYIQIENESPQTLHFAVRNDWPVMVSIIDKALANITIEEKIAISNRWIGVESPPDYSWLLRILALVVTAILLVLIVSAYWILKLRKEIRMRQVIQEELKTAKEAAEQANQVKSTFLATMSHEIRTPLHAISGMATMLKQTDITPVQDSYLDIVIQATRNMLNIINDVLDFSKMEAGKIRIERVAFNLDKILEQVVNIVYLKIEEKNLAFHLSKDPGVPARLWGDPVRIEQILINLVNNAVKFTESGEVSVLVQVKEKNERHYNLDFIVKDTGIGMSDEQISELFQPFNQADTSITRRFGGTGLGLSIVKNLVDLMDGTKSTSSIRLELAQPFMSSCLWKQI